MTDAILQVVKQIALGRPDSGRPLAAEVSRQRCREVLNDLGIGWSSARHESKPYRLASWDEVPPPLKEPVRRVAPQHKRKLTPPAPAAEIPRHSKAKDAPRMVPNYRAGRMEVAK